MTALTGLLWRNHVTRGRLAAVGGAGLVVVLLAVAILAGDGGASAARDLVATAGIGLLVPVGSVVFATSVLGDPAEDGTLAYYLNTPQPRWRIMLAAYVATAVVVVPVTVLPLVAALGMHGVSSRTIVAVTVAAGLGALAYSALFLALGTRFRHALLFGLLYTTIWEGVVAGFGTGLARLSVRQYVESLQDGLRGDPITDVGVAGPVAAGMLVVIVLAGTGVTTWFLRGHVSRA
jgi:ABC-2 type transport system permease protein